MSIPKPRFKKGDIVKPVNPWDLKRLGIGIVTKWDDTAVKHPYRFFTHGYWVYWQMLQGKRYITEDLIRDPKKE